MALIDRFSGDLDERRMSLGEHLEELRKHVFRCVFWIVIALTVCLCFQSRLMSIATYPFTSCMEELRREKASATARALIDQPAFVKKAFDELEKQESLESAA